MRVWNAAVDHRPAEIVDCTTVEDVRAGLSRAAASGLDVSVFGGGHDWLGRSVRPGGLVLDLSGMRDVVVSGGVAVAGGGAKCLDVMRAAEKAGCSVVAGTVGSVGMAGFAMGGGYGPLCGRYGIGADNVLGADVLLADGTLVRTSESEEPDLLWALRGGGGNFGVVTALRLRTHPLTTVLTGTVAFGWDQAADVLRRYSDFAADVPDEFTSLAGTATLPDGTPIVFFSPTWSGEASAGKPWMTRLAGLGRPLMENIRSRRLTELLREGDENFSVPVRRYDLATRNVASLSPDVVETLVAGSQERTSPFSTVIIHHFHGAATRRPVESTAFGRRDAHFQVELISSWRAGDGTADEKWAGDMQDRLAPYALPGGYPNLLGPDDVDQIAHAYGPNTHRLLELKRRYDPDSVFSATPLPG